MSINGFVLYFMVLSFFGYIYETFAMTIWSGKFENRGFLLGPIIPIYGAGATIATLLFTYSWTSASGIQIFLIGVIGSALIEYPTHYMLEKAFNQKWWDYSNAPLNLNGRVCLPAALGFGIGAVIIVKVINPFIIPIINAIPELIANIGSLVFTTIFSADIATTISIISDFEDHVAKLGEKVDDSLEGLLSHILNEDKPLKDKAYKVLYAPKNVKNKIREVSINTIPKTKLVSKLETIKNKNYKKVIKNYIKNKRI